MQLARPRQSRRLLARIASPVVPGGLRPYIPTRLSEWGGGLVATRSPNEERALAPIMDRAPELQLPRATAVPGTAVWSAAATAMRRRIDSFLISHNRSELRASWHHAVNMTAHELQRLASMDLSPYRFLLISRQTHPLLRALILAARAQRVPVVYVPHSPLTRFQVDLPVSHAALRGTAERDWVVAHTGADAAGISVVGNPATQVAHLPTHSLVTDRVPGVLAVSPDPAPLLQRMFEMIAHAGLDDVLVAPHPRSDMSMLTRLIPHGWQLHRKGLTVDLLRGGPRWVIQSSSGVAWESAVLGIPTADLRLDDRVPDYPLLDDADVFPILRSSDDVRRFVDAASTTDRGALRAHALRWCATDGAEAVALVRGLLDAVSESRESIVDGWAPGGVLLANSPLAAL